MSYWLYQGLTEPITVTQAPTVTADSWINDWLTPIRRPFVVALIASGLVPFDPSPPEAVAFPSGWSQPPASRQLIQYQSLALVQTVAAPAGVTMGWEQPFFDPVRVKRRSADQPYLAQDLRPVVSFGWFESFSDPSRRKPPVILQQALGWGIFTPAAPITDIGWYGALSEPVRLRRFASVHQPYLAQDLRPIVSYGWFGPLSEPVRYRVFYTRLQRFFTEDTDVTPDPQIIPWYAPLSEPTRLRRLPTLTAPLQQTIAFDPFPLVNRGVMGWFAPLGEPVRVRQRLKESNQSSIAFVFAPEVITTDKWFAHLSQPYLVRLFHASQQQAYTNDSELFPQPSELIQWFSNLSEPTRDLKVGLSARLQMSLAAPERVLPTPDVTVIMNAIEDNQDIFSAGVVTYNQAVRAVVSIEEIEVGDDAGLSIREP